MAKVSETTILQEGFVKITNLRTVIGTTTYSMSDITAVNITMQAKSKKPFWLVVVGILFSAWGLLDQTRQFLVFLFIGIALIVAAITLLLTAKPTYAVQIGGTAGKSSVLRSTDSTFVKRVVDAMNQAIARRGKNRRGKKIWRTPRPG